MKRFRSDILGEGLASPHSGLLVTLGLEVPGIKVVGKWKVGPNTYRIDFESSIRNPSPVQVWVNGRYAGKMLGRSLVVTTPAGEDLRLELRDDSAVWPPFDFPNTVDIQWERVADADLYQVYNGETLVATIADDGRQYYVYQSGQLLGGQAYTLSVRAVSPAGNESAVEVVSFTMVAYPASEDVSFTYNGNLYAGMLTVTVE